MSEDVGKKTRNIELKIGLMVISITTVILIVYGIHQYIELEKDQTDALNRISEMASDRLAQNLAGPMWDMDEAKIERAVLSEMTEKTIYGVTVSENYEGRVLLSRQRDDNWDIINRSEAVPADFIRKKKDIIKAEEKIGSIEIFVTRNFMKKQLVREAWKSAVTILFLDSCILIFLIFALKRFLFRPVRKAVEQMSEIAAQVAAAADQVSMSSQSLAGGSSEQAASVEQASSSLEEVSAMVRQNADHANAANTLVRNTRESIRQAVEAMNRLNRSIESISSSSGETSKIVKTIDEIAFQTNLLALNAAVESARAGQAGAGFAVVADEVRNLAMRAAAAAKNTGELIENTLQRVGEGTTLVQDTARAFDLVNENSGKATELVEEIAAASIEQSQGIEHVNRAVSGINMITQQNTADAEQSASASEQLNAQAEHMRHIVRELLELIGVRMDR